MNRHENPNRPVIEAGRRQPHEIAFLLASLVLGGLYLAHSAAPPRTVEALVSPWVRALWYVLLLASGVGGLVAVALPDVLTALLLERVAMLVGAAAIAIYVLALASRGGGPTVGAGTFLAFWCLANLARAWQIGHHLRRARKGTSQ